MDADATLAASADSSFASSDAVQNTIVKMSLESFCKHITLGGCKKLLLLTKLREQALQMNDVVTETWHLIQLYCRDYFEKAASAENNHGLDMLKWDGARVMEFLLVVTVCTRPSAKLNADILKI